MYVVAPADTVGVMVESRASPEMRAEAHAGEERESRAMAVSSTWEEVTVE